MRTSVAVAAFLSLLFLSAVQAGREDKNFESELRFEPPHSGPTALRSWGGGPPETIFFDSEIVHSGKGAARLERTASSPSTFTTITRKIPVDFGGKFIEMRGWLKTANVIEYAGLWMREDGASGMVQFDNMKNQGLGGTHDWAQYSIRLPIDENARELYFGVLMAGEGTVWADDLEFLVDGKPLSEAPGRKIEPTVLDTDREFAAGSGIAITSLNKKQTEHLVLLGRVWGFLKYHHPRVAWGELHWDFELFRVMPEVLSAQNSKACNSALAKWVAEIGVPESCDPCASAPEDTHLLPRLDWIGNRKLLGSTLSAQLQSIHTNRFSGNEHFYVSQMRNVGNPQFDHEPDYASMVPPDAGYRVLALFRLWNIIEYWFPYRDLLDDDWPSLLREFLPRFVEADTWDAYQLEMVALIARIKDTHASMWSARDVIPPSGKCFWPVDIRFIDGRAVVTRLIPVSGEPTNEFQVGDAITRIDGKTVEDLIEQWAPWYPASNQARRLWTIAGMLSRGKCGECEVGIYRDGEPQTITVTRLEGFNRKPTPRDRPGDTFQLLSDDVVYLKLSSAKIRAVPGYLEKASGTRGLVIDIRNYPSDFVVFALGGRLVEQTTPFARFTVGDLDNPGAFTWGKTVELEPQSPGYKGKVAILVDEVSISNSEYTAMAMRAGPNAVVIGSTTAGADGNVSPIPLPGGLKTQISGIGVFYPDKTPTQRVGIVPDIFVTPTVAGIRAGRDEVLEAAIRHILGPDADEERIREMGRRE